MKVRTTPVAGGSAPRRAAPLPRWVGWYLVVVGAGVALLWVASLPGAFDDGMFSYAGTAAAGNIPIFHVAAEAAMAATALAAGVAVLRRHRYAPGAALLANGMLLYSAVNSSGWLWHNQRPIVALTAATLVGSVASTWVLLVSRRPYAGQQP